MDPAGWSGNFWSLKGVHERWEGSFGGFLEPAKLLADGRSAVPAACGVEYAKSASDLGGELDRSQVDPRPAGPKAIWPGGLVVSVLV